MARDFSAKSSDTLESPRVRFNWGFHDGTFDAFYKHPNRSDLKAGERDHLHRVGLDDSTPLGKAYGRGYRAGQKHFATHGTRPDSSEAAYRAEFCNQEIPGLTE